MTFFNIMSFSFFLRNVSLFVKKLQVAVRYQISFIINKIAIFYSN